MSGIECTQLEELANKLHALVTAVQCESREVQEKRLNDWFIATPLECKNYAFILLGIYKARDQISIHTGAIAMSGDQTNVHVGGDMTGSAVGTGAKVDAQYIQNLKNNVGNSGNIDAEGQKYFRDAIDELNSQPWDDDIKKEILDELEKLRAEIAKPAPKSQMISKCWGAIKGLAGKLPVIIELGKWIAKTIPGLPPLA